MALPFNVWEVNDAFNRALEFEEEQEEQCYEEEPKAEDEFVIRFSPKMRGETGSRYFKGPVEISKLIITTDNISAGFADSYLLSHETVEKAGLICGVNKPSKDGNTVFQSSFWDKTCFIYNFRDEKDVLICQMKLSLDAKHIFNWVAKLFEFIKPKHVITLTSIPQCNLQFEDLGNDGYDFICKLKTSAFDTKTLIPELPQPNLVKDLPAAVLTHCQVHSIPAILYILVTETFSFDVNAVKSFATVLKEEIFLDVKKGKENKVKDALKKLCNMKIPNSGVYI